MKAVVHERYGPPESLQIRDVARPTPGPDEVLVRVKAAAASATDAHLVRADPWVVRLAMGLFRPKYRIPGTDIAGEVVHAGANVDSLRAGDTVFGTLSECGFGGFAEYAAAPESALARKPRTMSFAEAAAVPVSALAALQGLRDLGGIKAGDHVLLHGASGGVGTFAIQIARSAGARVTAVCSAKNVALVKTLGADAVVDYQHDDLTQLDDPADIILDMVGNQPLAMFRTLLKPGGKYVMVGGAVTRMLLLLVCGRWLSLLWGRQFRFLISRPRRTDLLFLSQLIDTGELNVVIDRQFRLSEVPDAIRYVESGHPGGKVVVAMARPA
jgi:NADPH:quinone reductase-like Zn-dependent oxidoreductase